MTTETLLNTGGDAPAVQEGTTVTDPIVEGQEGGDNQGDEAPKVEGKADVPLTYDLKAPEGVELADDELQGIAETAKELGLSNDQAQALVNLKTQWHSEASDQAAVNLGNLAKSWQDEIRNDADFGGEKFDASIQDVKRVMDAFGSTELKQALDETGLGNHPDLFRFVAKIGTAMREDKLITGDPSSQPRTHAEVLYGKTEG